MNRQGLSDHFRKMPHKGIIVNRRIKTIYMKPAKTAGTSILRHFLKPRIKGFINIKDNELAFYKWLATITDEDLEEYYIFATVRNPYTRFSSLASYFGHTVEHLAQNFDSICEDEVVKEHSHPLNIYTHLNGSKFVNHICRVEALDSHFNIVKSILGIRTIKPIPVVNTSSNRGMKDFKTAESIRFVNTLYGDDFKLLKYQKIDDVKRS